MEHPCDSNRVCALELRQDEGCAAYGGKALFWRAQERRQDERAGHWIKGVVHWIKRMVHWMKPVVCIQWRGRNKSVGSTLSANDVYQDRHWYQMVSQ